MTAFEQGYEAFLLGKSAEDNPFDPKEFPCISKRWGEGWQAARLRKIEKAR